jgi:hypothetical protein
MSQRGINMKSRPSTICECGSHAFASTSRWGVALVSAEDAWLLSKYCWSLQWNGLSAAYARSERCAKDIGDPTAEHLHRIVFGSKGADHKDGNGLNCQRSNLRKSTTKQNMRNRRSNLTNRSGFKGVSCARSGKFRARIMENDVEIRLGHFDSAEAAARAYDAEALRRFGEFARLNFPEVAS